MLSYSLGRLVCVLRAFYVRHLVGCLLLAVPVFNSAIATAQRPNILWLTTEDIGPELGCYGDANAVTPNIDAFAKDALKYRTAWSNYPVCAPARTTIITGQYASAMAAGNMRSAMPLSETAVMFPKLLRSAGYYCTNNSKEDYNVAKPEGVWDASSNKAHYRSRQSGQPFFSVFNYNGTHESKIRKRPHQAVIDPATLTLTPFWPDLPEVRQDLGQYYDNISKMDRWFQNHLDDLEKSGQADNTIVFFYGDHGSGMPGFKRYAGDRGMRVALLVHVPFKHRSLAPDYRPGGVSNRLVSFVDLAPTVLSLAGVEPHRSMQGRPWYGPHQQPPEEFLYGYRERMDEYVDLSHCLRDQRYQYTVNYMPHLPAGQPLAYQMQTPTTLKWFEAFEAGRTNAIQSLHWLPRSAEEFYDLRSDPYGINNLIEDPAYLELVNRFRAAHRTQSHSFQDFSFVPEPISTQGYVDVSDAAEVSAVFRSAQLAVLEVGDGASDQAVLNLLNSDRPAERYWASLGCALRLNRWAVGGNLRWKTGQAALIQRLSDDEPIVRVVAAQGLIGDSKTPVPVRNQSLATLLNLADMNTEGYLVAVAALNGLDRNRKWLTESQLRSIADLPTTAPSRKRGTDDVKKLLARFARFANTVP